MKTSIHFGGLWFHIEWSDDGKIGVDQHGTKWYDKDCPHTDTVLEKICLVMRDQVMELSPLIKKSCGTP